MYDILFKNKVSQPTNSEEELKSRKGAVLDLKWNPQIHEIEEEEEKYEPQPEGKLQAWENLLRSQARPVPKCPQELQVESCQKVLKALEDFKESNGGQDALALMDQELNELNDLNEKNNQEEKNDVTEKNIQEEKNEVKDADQKNTQEEKNEVTEKNIQEEKNEVKDADQKNTQEEKNEVKDIDDKNLDPVPDYPFPEVPRGEILADARGVAYGHALEKNEVKDTDEENTQEEKVQAEVKVSDDKKRAPTNTEDKDDPESQPRKKAKKTFANRAPPKTEGPYIQWAAMKHAYEKGNAPIPTVNEGKFYNYCREKWGGNLPEPTADENPDLFQRYCQAKSEAEGAEVTIELRAEVYKSSALALYQQWMAERMAAAPLLE